MSQVETHVFHLRVYLKIAGQICCIWQDPVKATATDYESARKMAIKEFVDNQPALKDFKEHEKIQVLYWGTEINKATHDDKNW